MSNGFITYKNLVQHLRMNGRYRVNVHDNVTHWKMNMHLWHMIQSMARDDPDLRPTLHAETHPDYIEIELWKKNISFFSRCTRGTRNGLRLRGRRRWGSSIGSWGLESARAEARWRAFPSWWGFRWGLGSSRCLGRKRFASCRRARSCDGCWSQRRS